MTQKKAFTLIELLIVVAIIAILAAIAVPNFLEAQTRSKVSRCRADMRTVVTGLEIYKLDNNQYPMMNDVGNGIIPPPTYALFQDISAGGDDHARVPSWITTPIAYLSSLPFDPFIVQTPILGTNQRQIDVGKRYVYFNFDQFLTLNATSFQPRIDDAGNWLIYGLGSDRDANNLGAVGGVYVNYDSTNGTISSGNIFRTQKNPELYPVR